MLNRLEMVHLVQLQVNLALGNEWVLRYQPLDELESVDIQLALSWHKGDLLRPLLRCCLTLLGDPFFSSCVGKAVLLPALKDGLQLFEINIVLVCDSADGDGLL